jgi:hypothetical protein
LPDGRIGRKNGGAFGNEKEIDSYRGQIDYPDGIRWLGMVKANQTKQKHKDQREVAGKANVF